MDLRASKHKISTPAAHNCDVKSHLGIYEEFKNELPKKIAKTPMPEKTFLSMYTPEGDRREQSDEITAEIKGKGYMHTVGTFC
jgi:hypothetical protein